MIIIVDYGIANVGSVLNMIRKVGGEARLSSSIEDVTSAGKLILPGVGAFDAGVSALNNSGLYEAIRYAVLHNGAMLLGICLGMQLLLESSEEGSLQGLGLVPGKVRKFQFDQQGLKVPHMGWNGVQPTRLSSLFDMEGEAQRFYFVHSFYVECADEKDVAGVTNYGHDFTSVLERNNVIGVQFHPEKSHRFGMALLQRFLEL
jgi:imidazole glycerol-phosphate synthase subunit HisH